MSDVNEEYDLEFLDLESQTFPNKEPLRIESNQCGNRGLLYTLFKGVIIAGSIFGISVMFNLNNNPIDNEYDDFVKILFAAEKNQQTSKKLLKNQWENQQTSKKTASGGSSIYKNPNLFVNSNSGTPVQTGKTTQPSNSVSHTTEKTVLVPVNWGKSKSDVPVKSVKSVSETTQKTVSVPVKGAESKSNAAVKSEKSVSDTKDKTVPITQTAQLKEETKNHINGEQGCKWLKISGLGGGKNLISLQEKASSGTTKKCPSANKYYTTDESMELLLEYATGNGWTEKSKSSGWTPSSGDVGDVIFTRK